MEEINGLGKRINVMEVTLGRIEERTSNLKKGFDENKRDTWAAITKLVEGSNKLMVKQAIIFSGILVVGFIISNIF